jgi:hypothetical protein
MSTELAQNNACECTVVRVEDRPGSLSFLRPPYESKVKGLVGDRCNRMRYLTDTRSVLTCLV